MKASLAGAAATFNALPTQMALLADALRARREAEQPATEAASTATEEKEETTNGED
jgi:large subunit ribosomal protein L10